MKRAEEYGIMFNADKCIIVVTDINVLASRTKRKVFDPTAKELRISN